MEELSESLNDHTSFFAGSTRWMAPELILGLTGGDRRTPPISTASDVYAFGCVCLEVRTRQILVNKDNPFLHQVATGNVPFPHLRNDYAVTVDLIRGEKPSRPTQCYISYHAQPTFWALLDRCWSADVSMRPSMGEVAGLLGFLHDADPYVSIRLLALAWRFPRSLTFPQSQGT